MISRGTAARRPDRKHCRLWNASRQSRRPSAFDRACSRTCARL